MDDETKGLILDLLDSNEAMVLATVREDGFPQATVMNYVHDGLSVYFWCDSKTQKARNLALNPKVSAALGRTLADWTKLQGLSFGGIARHVADRNELELAMTLSLAKYPQMVRLVPDAFEHPLLYRIDVVAFTVLDYTQSLGHRKVVVVPESEAANRGWRSRSARRTA